MTGKGISTEILVGQVTTTAWDYCHKIVSFYRCAYQYDDIGNRRSSLERGVQSAEYVANNLNQYTSIEQLVLRSLGEGGSNNFLPAYDLDGNQTLVKTSTGVWQVTYNGENRPVRWVRGNTVVTMDFDSMGRRTFYRETENGTEVSASRFFYDGYLMIQQLDHDSPHAVQKEFIWDPTEPVATKPLVFRQNGMDSPYLTHDGNKNVADVIRAAPYNDSVGHYEYAPFGAVTSAVGSRAADNPFRFSSELCDVTFGLVYYNYRHYNHEDGRWISRDAFQEYGGLNLYLHCNNGIDTPDMLGLSAECSVRGVFNILELSVSLTSQDRMFNQQKLYDEADALLRELGGMGFNASTTGLGTGVKQLIKMVSASSKFLKNKLKKGKETTVLEKSLRKYFENNFKGHLFRVEGSLKFQLCECVNGKLRYVDQDEVKEAQEVNFDAMYDVDWYLNEVLSTQRDVEKELLAQMFIRVRSVGNGK